SRGGRAAVWDPAKLDRPRSDSQSWRPLRLRGNGSFEHPGGSARSSDGTRSSARLGRARARVADQEARSNRSCSETFAAGAMGHRIRIRYFEPAFLKIVAVIQERSAHKKRALGIDHNADI